MRELNLSLLGQMEIHLNGSSIQVESDKVRALLVYLAIENGTPHRRETLAEMFWPEKPEGVSRNNLKQALANLRKALGDRGSRSPFLRISRKDIQFNTSSSHWIDVKAFIDTIDACRTHMHEEWSSCKTCLDELTRAENLYLGEFLGGLYINDAQEFNDWVVIKREAYQRRFAEVLQKLTHICEDRGEYLNASKYGQRLVELEPWNEESHRRLMHLYALNGMRSIALRQYHICRLTLFDEFGVQPSRETEALFEEIKAWKTDLNPGRRGSITHQNRLAIQVLPQEKESHERVHPKKLPVTAILGIITAVVLIGAGTIYWSKTAKQQREPNVSGDRPANSSVENSNPVLQGAFTAPTIPEIPEVELEALLLLFEETNGENWEHSTGWLSGSSPCKWYGVVCSSGVITRLDLAGNLLSGTIPPELGNLGNLEVLDLGSNQLNSPIPPELGNLSGLIHMDLSGNPDLHGPIPPKLGNLSDLEYLDLSSEFVGSALSGEIPAEIGRLSKLTFLRIQNCLVSGSLPEQLYNLRNLVHLEIANTQISGEISPEIGNLILLEFLDLGGNPHMRGSIPPEIGNLTLLKDLFLGDSNLSGELPKEIGNLTRLRTLLVDGNSLHGPLPLSLINLHSQTFYFDRTTLCEPANQGFQEWLAGIDDLGRTGRMCENLE